MRVSRQQVLHRTVRAHALGRLAKDPVEAVRRAAGIYATPPSIHLGLALRVRDYQPTMLDRELLERRTLVRTPAVRGSVYVLPVDWVSAALTLTLVKPLITILATRGVSEPAYAKLADRIEATLADGHKSSAEIQAALGKHLPDELAISGVLRRMSHEGRIVRTKVRGGAKSQSYEYARMSDWVDLPPRPSRAEALALLARPWVLANGPATIADLAWWAMVPQKDARPALAAIGAREVEVEG
ncbi:MAG TPA: crosslink repair DNA glycosylase YcaQ family protein, partial [bacterium]|nr:crosslink repair DNA glycosylase YcaQ family protein [bacterium]